MPLRWMLGGTAALFIAGWLALVALGDKFRGSFGASANGAATVVLPVVLAALFLATTMWPDRRVLLHLGAVAAVSLLVASIVLTRTTAFVGGLGILYSGAWLLFYYLMIRKRSL